MGRYQGTSRGGVGSRRTGPTAKGGAMRNLRGGEGDKEHGSLGLGSTFVVIKSRLAFVCTFVYFAWYLHPHAKRCTIHCASPSLTPSGSATAYYGPPALSVTAHTVVHLTRFNCSCGLQGISNLCLWPSRPSPPRILCNYLLQVH